MDHSTAVMSDSTPAIDTTGGKPLDEFHRFNTMDPFLRDHALQFMDNKTLLNYSQCSKVCNGEIQKYNSTPPVTVILHQHTDAVRVYLYYTRPYTPIPASSAPRLTVNIFANSDETMEDVETFLRKTYRYVTEGHTHELVIDMREWPKKLMESGFFSTVHSLTVSVCDTMLSGFLQIVELNKMQVTLMHMTDHNRGLPLDAIKLKKVFNSQFFRRMPKVSICLSYIIDDEDFLGFKNCYIFVDAARRGISDDAIRQKIAELNQSSEKWRIVVNIPSTAPAQFDYSTLFPNHYRPFHNRRGLLVDTIILGNVHVKPRNRTDVLLIKKR